MAVRRTFKQKQKAQLHRQQALRYSLPPGKAQVTPAVGEPTPARARHLGLSLHEIFGYSPNLLWQDILKTLATTILVVGVLLALKYLPYFQSN